MKNISVADSNGGGLSSSSSTRLFKMKENVSNSPDRGRGEALSSAWAVGSTTPRSLSPTGHDCSTAVHISTICSSSLPLSLSPVKKARGPPASFSILSSQDPVSSQKHKNNPFYPHTSVYHERLIHQPSMSVESVLSAACEAMAFDIAEVWLRTGPKTHRLINSHLRPASLECSVRNELVEVYYGERSSERTHRLSPALCKRAKEARDVVWVTSQPPPVMTKPQLAQNHDFPAVVVVPQENNNFASDTALLKTSISDVQTAVAVPVCHESSRTNLTFLFFSMRRAVMHPSAVEFLVHMSLSAAVSSVNQLVTDIYQLPTQKSNQGDDGKVLRRHSNEMIPNHSDDSSCHILSPILSSSLHQASRYNQRQPHATSHANLSSPRPVSVTGAHLDLRWNVLSNVEYLTDGGNSWIHTAVMDQRPVVVKTLKPECQDVALALNEIEAELDIHAKLNHPHIVSLRGAGLTSKGVRFVVLERLDGGTLAQVLGYDHRIRDRRRRFWRRQRQTSPFSYAQSLTHARDLADALAYCQAEAMPGSMCLHRDLKPDNVGFTLDGRLKLIDFGLARWVHDASPTSNEKYQMSGETGSLRYMAPEVAEGRPYNHKADVYSFGVMFWELLVQHGRPYDGMSRDTFYQRVVHGGERPAMPKHKWPPELVSLLRSCWHEDMDQRPNFREVVTALNELLSKQATRGTSKNKDVLPDSPRRRVGLTRLGSVSKLIDRHSSWF